MIDVSAFEPPQQTIRWARDAIQEMELDLHQFFAHKRHREVIDIDQETGYNAYKVQLVDPLPTAITRKANEALQWVRNAFDQILYAGCVAIGKKPKNDIHFPWRMNPADLEAALQGKKSKIPAEFWEIIRREQPYPTGRGYVGGDDKIRELARIANKKHTIGLNIQGRVNFGRYPDVIGKNVKAFIMPFPHWDPVKNEITLAIYAGDVKITPNYKIAFHIVLGEMPPLDRIPAQVVLRDFADKAERFLESLKAECINILS